ncbi:zinc-binding dehydrogenase [Kitasatospora camelliae]|uniref:Zinc-binding dehydrogenase n=1 Tax=Kitasatospora camelliae TaxID=3156397 RepID=A0AAU8K3N6_9ACTN
MTGSGANSEVVGSSRAAAAGSVAGRVRDGAAVDPRAFFASGATLRAVAVGSRQQFLAMNRVIEEHRLRPEIDRVFRFEEAPAAFRQYASGAVFGKVVITCGG